MTTDPFLSISYDDRAIRESLQKLQRKIRDLTPVMKQVGEQVSLSIDQGFEEERAPDGTPWKPNSPRTIARKRAEGRIQKILQNTGRLRSSINYRATADSVVIGTNVSYAKQNFDTRPFLGISKNDQEEIIQLLSDYLAKDN